MNGIGAATGVVGGSKPRVGVNLLWIRPGKIGGTEEATTRTLAAVRDRDEVQLVLFATRGLLDAHPELVDGCEVVDHASDITKPRRVWLENTWLKRHSRAKGLDVMHHPGGLIPVLRPRVPTHLTIQDIQPAQIPKNFNLAQRTVTVAWTKWSANVAGAVSVPSMFVRATVIDEFGVDPGKVYAVPWGAPSPASEARLTALRAAKPSNAVPPAVASGARFALYPAAAWRHKNHAALVEAWAEVNDLALVLTAGTGNPRALAALEKAHRTSPVRERIFRVGRVPEPDIEWLLARADFVVFPSGYEGFGLPVGEGARLGTAVLASDIEVLSDFIPPEVPRLIHDRPDTWAATINAFALDAKKPEYVELIRRKTDDLSWDLTARCWTEIYRALAEGRPAVLSEP